MLLMKTRNLILGISLAIALGASSSVADAALLSGWFGPESAVYQPVHATTAYRPAAVASGCNTCAPRAVTYAARPVYRPVTVARGCNTCAPTTVMYRAPTTVMYPTRRVAAYAPVTTLRPVAACNSCGTQTITMRPVTTYVRRYAYRPTYVYRRTYRPIFGASACSTCTPAYAARPIVTSGCSTGACGIPATTNYMPTTTIVSPVTTYSSTTPTYAAPASPTYAAPTLAPATPTYGVPAPPTYATPTPAAKVPTTGTPQPDLKSTYQVKPENKTFKKEPTEVEKEDDDSALQPIPQSTGKSSGAGTGIFRKPRLADPKDRTARAFVPRWEVQQAVHVQPVASPRRELSADGWRSAR